CRAGISTLAPVAGLWPMRFSRCCTTSFATPGSTNSPHRSNSCPVNCYSSSKNAPASARLMPKRSAKIADAIAMKLGITKTAMTRVRAGS
ncbi:MAG: hypothetical protein OXG04_01005, partial [Acidobacteria bacterium]|nr:hypothetical protein [Acidobacteriota bacterium]